MSSIPYGGHAGAADQDLAARYTLIGGGQFAHEVVSFCWV
jgi:hypothetical protein